jgi:hypothetical protein
MKSIVNFLSKIIPKDPPKQMGRWNIDYCNKKLNTKIDLSNEDHCGPCGYYAITKANTINEYHHDDKNNKTISMKIK